MNLHDMSLQELKQLRHDLDRAITSFEQRQLANAREKLEAHARELGFSLAEVAQFGKSFANRRQPLLGAKYRNPKNPQEAWTGRGRRPRWLKVALNNTGANLEDFLICPQ